MKSLYPFKLENGNMDTISKRASVLAKEHSPSQVPKKNMVAGFFRFEAEDYGCSIWHYQKTTREYKDPYTEDVYEIPDVRTSAYSFINDGEGVRMFFSGGSNADISSNMSIKSDDMIPSLVDGHYIRYLNEADEGDGCYQQVIGNHSLYSLGRYGKDGDGHSIKEDYYDLDQRERSIGVPFVTYAKVSVSTSNSVLRLRLYTNGKITAVNNKGTYLEFSRDLTEAMNIIEASMHDFNSCNSR